MITTTVKLGVHQTKTIGDQSMIEDEVARPVEVDLNAPRKTCEIIANEKRKYHEITSMSEKTESKLQSSLYMINQLEDRVDFIHGDVDVVKDRGVLLRVRKARPQSRRM